MGPGTDIQLGPFTLLEPVGRGGMAEVWRGVHREQGVPVAVKVMIGPNATSPQYVMGFRNEVRAVAGLDHPSVVMVFDHGEVDEIAATRVEHFADGAPFLVMELASGGTLENLSLPLPWRQLRTVLLVLLDALAHAHARGVIHRDLKPANMLICRGTDVRPGLKLTDFGIAHAVGRLSKMGNLEISMGTPYYMAPEQIEGLWRDYGPWTDLYAIGVIAFELATGTLPFRSDNLMRLAYKHLKDDPPRLDADVEVPDGFEGWVHRLLAKNPADRFQMAADAAWALAQLSGERPSPGSTVGELAGFEGIESPVVSFRDTMVVPQSQTAEFTMDTAGLIRAAQDAPRDKPSNDPAGISFEDLHSPLDSGGYSARDLRIRLADREVPPMPSTWRRPTPAGPSMQLVGTGLALYGLRTIPLVDREPERDVVWKTLRQVREEGTARLVLLRGDAGTGKSRLVEWILERAHEVGAIRELRATHGVPAGPGHGLPRMLARHFRTVNQIRRDVVRRIESRLRQLELVDEYEWNALAEVVHPAEERDIRAGARRVRFSSPTERYGVIRRLLSLEAGERTMVIWLDDVQWGADALGFAKYVLDYQPIEPAPILFLATARDDALVEQPDERRLLNEILTLDSAQEVAVSALGEDDQTELVNQLLMLEGDLAKRVLDRTQGNPLFAVQLVGDWVERGVLEVGDRGFVLKPGEEATLPDDLYDVWTARIDRALEAAPDTSEGMLEIAAVLGGEVDYPEWESACAELGLPFDEELIESLSNARLAQAGNESFRFAHGILREALLRRVAEHGRVAEYHLAAADMLKVEYPPGKRGIAERIGRHLVETERPETALEPLLEGAAQRRENSEYREALELLELRDRVLFESRVQQDDARWGQNWVLRSWICANQGRVEDAAMWAGRAEKAARQHGWTKVLPQALVGLGVAARERGELDEAATHFDQARALYQDAGARLGLAHAMQGMGVVARMRGDLSEAERLIREALRVHDRIENAFGVAEAKLRLAEVLIDAGRIMNARAVLEQSLNEHQALGEERGAAWCLYHTGTIARMAGDLDGAIAAYEESRQRLARLSTTAGLVPERALALIDLHQSRFVRAKEVLLRLQERFRDSALTREAQVTAVLLAAAAAGTQEWADAIDALSFARPLAEDTVAASVDVRQWSKWVAQAARTAGQSQAAEDAEALAQAIGAFHPANADESSP